MNAAFLPLCCAYHKSDGDLRLPCKEITMQPHNGLTIVSLEHLVATFVPEMAAHAELPCGHTVAQHQEHGCVPDPDDEDYADRDELDSELNADDIEREEREHIDRDRAADMRAENAHWRR
jgi:hypothetical protein